jgi:F0F1-type ATP synthase delta subunit
LQAEYQQLEQRYAAAVELLGERDEQLEEMAADLADVKQLYKQQIEALVVQLAEAEAPAQA